MTFHSKTKPNVVWNKERGLLHIEVPGGIVNINVGLSLSTGNKVTRVEILADGDRYAGETPWWIEGEKCVVAGAWRIIQELENTDA